MAFSDSVVEVKKKVGPVASKQSKKPKHAGGNNSEGAGTTTYHGPA